MNYPLLKIASIAGAALLSVSCASEKKESWSTQRDPLMQHFAGNFETATDKDGQPRSGSDRRSAFENKSYSGTKSFNTKSFDKKEFRTKGFRTKEYGRDAFQFVGDRNLRAEESSLTSQRFSGEGQKADTDKTLFDRNKEIAHTPFEGASKAAPTQSYYPAEKAQREGDAEFKGVVTPYERDRAPITFGDIKSMLNH